MNPVTLQINLAPSDYRHARLILPHQLRALAGQVSEILLIIDLHKSPGRFSEGWEHGRDEILKLATSIAGTRVLIVDDCADAAQGPSMEFFGARPIPKKDFRGGPFYSYFFGLHAARHPLVLHCDADMLIGGGSQSWVREAIQLMSDKPELLVCGPLPGPPSPDHTFRQLQATCLNKLSRSYAFHEMSTRLFLIDRRRFQAKIGQLRPERPGIKQCLLAAIDGNPRWDLPENILSRAMRAHGLTRVDFLGKSPGLWSLHPPYRCEDFYNKLPAIIERVETANLPAAQLGDHDINASLVDWSAALRAMESKRWWRRAAKRIRSRHA